MGVSALESHAAGKKHTKLVEEKKRIKAYFSSQLRYNRKYQARSWKNNVDTPGKSKTIDEFMVNTHSKNAEILWCMKVVKSHYSYNSCSDFTKILTKMCPDSDIATKISLGKTKCQYMILYGLAPYYKNELIKRINDSLLLCIIWWSFKFCYTKVWGGCQH